MVGWGGVREEEGGRAGKGVYICSILARIGKSGVDKDCDLAGCGVGAQDFYYLFM